MLQKEEEENPMQHCLIWKKNIIIWRRLWGTGYK
jgi:hypothetical protein